MEPTTPINNPIHANSCSSMENAIPKTITQRQSSQKSPPKSNKNKSNTRKEAQADDNQTTTAMNTQMSYTQDTISNLQNTRQQHQPSRRTR
jgi:hypothetical protein